MATPDMNREHRKALAAITSDPERALLHGRRSFDTLPENAAPAQQAHVLQRMLTETAAIKTVAPGRAFVAAHGALELAYGMPEGAERSGIKKSALQAMGGIAAETYDSGNQVLGGKMFEKALELAQKTGPYYDSEVTRGVKLARGEPVDEPAATQTPKPADRNSRRARNARISEMDELQRSQADWHQGQAADFAAGRVSAGASPPENTAEASGSISSGQPPKRAKLSNVGTAPLAAPKKKGGWGKSLVVAGIAAVVAGTALTSYLDMRRENQDLQVKNQAMTQIALNQAARARAAVSVDPYWAQQAGITPDGKAIREQLESFRSRHPTEFNQIAEDMKRTGTIEGGLNRLVEIDPQAGPALRTQALAFVAASSGPNGGNSAVAGREAMVTAFDEVNFNGQQADALRRGQVPRQGVGGPGVTPR